MYKENFKQSLRQKFTSGNIVDKRKESFTILSYFKNMKKNTFILLIALLTFCTGATSFAMSESGKEFMANYFNLFTIENDELSDIMKRQLDSGEVILGESITIDLSEYPDGITSAELERVIESKFQNDALELDGGFETSIGTQDDFEAIILE